MSNYYSDCQHFLKVIESANYSIILNKKRIQSQDSKIDEINRLLRKYNHNVDCSEEEIVEYIGKLQRLYNSNKEKFNSSSILALLSKWIKTDQAQLENPQAIPEPPAHTHS